jgi:hypothetical protein
MRSSSIFVLTLTAAICLAACEPIVGARCREGLTFCGTCVDLESDPRSCGGCGIVCADGVCTSGMCLGGVADGGMDAGGADGGDTGGVDGGDAGEPGDVDGGDGGRADGEVPERDGGDRDDGGRVVPDGGDGGPPLCDLGEILCDRVCRDGLSDPESCGDCGARCAPGELCAAGVCSAICAPPLRLCAGRCVDIDNDPDNCGSCGNVCASGLCIEGECSEPVAGHVVVIGHDYVMSRRGMSRLAGNALFLARGNPVNVLVWEGESTMPSRNGTDAAINQVASAIGRSWLRVAAFDPDKVTLTLAAADAFVIYAQDGASDDDLRALGATWSRALSTFVHRGGVIVMFETMTATNAGTWQLLDAAGLFTATGRSDATGAIIEVTAPSDAVALAVPLAYSAERETVRFETTETTVVTSDPIGPVVIHRTITP